MVKEINESTLAPRRTHPRFLAGHYIHLPKKLRPFGRIESQFQTSIADAYRLFPNEDFLKLYQPVFFFEKNICKHYKAGTPYCKWYYLQIYPAEMFSTRFPHADFVLKSTTLTRKGEIVLVPYLDLPTKPVWVEYNIIEGMEIWNAPHALKTTP